MSNENPALSSQEISEIIRMQQREEVGKQKSQTRGVNLKARNFARPVKPIFEGKSVVEAMARRNSDSTTNSEKLAELDSDEISLSSVQNLPTIPSIAESPGLFSMLASFSRFSGPSKTTTISQAKSDDSRRIGELPNKAKLQQLGESHLHMVDFKQNSGSLASSETESINSGKRLSLLQHRGSSYTNRSSGGRSTFHSLNDADNEAWKDTLNNDDFFAAMDGDRVVPMPKVPEEMEDAATGNTASNATIQKSKERRALRGNAKPTSSEIKRTQSGNGEMSSSTELASSASPQHLDVPSIPQSDWTPIVPLGTTIQRRKISSTIDESEHSLSSIAAKRRPLAIETLMAQESAKKQQEELAALMAQSMETLDLDDIDESVDSHNPHESPTCQNWEDLIGQAYEKKASQPLALSVDEDGESSDDDDILFRPKSRELQQIEDKLQKQEEQLRSVIQSTPEAYEALQETEILSQKEQKVVKQVNGDWHEVRGEATKFHTRNITEERKYIEDVETGEEVRSTPKSREARRRESDARKQRRQVQTLIETTPDTKNAIKVAKALSKKEKKATRKTSGEWHEVEIDVGKPLWSRVDKAKDGSNDMDDGTRSKSKIARSLEESTRRQQEVVEDLILDASDARDALTNAGGSRRHDDRVSRKTKKDWHGIENDKIRTHGAAIDNDRSFYPEIGIEKEDTRKVQNAVGQRITNSPAKRGPKSFSSSSNTKGQAKKKEIIPTNAYPVSDMSITEDDDLPKDPLLLLKKKKTETDTNQRLGEPQELATLDTQQRHDWHGVDPGRRPFNSQDNYSHIAKGVDKGESDLADRMQTSATIHMLPSKGDFKFTPSPSSNKAESKKKVVIPTNAYPVSDKPTIADDDLSKDPILLLKKRIPESDVNQKISDPEELTRLNMKQRHDWHEIDTGQHPLRPRGYYNQIEKDADTPSNISIGEGNDPRTDKIGFKTSENASTIENLYQPSEKARMDTKDNAEKRKKSSRSQCIATAIKANGEKKEINFDWQRVPSQYVRSPSKEANADSRKSKGRTACRKRISGNEEKKKSTFPKRDMASLEKKETGVMETTEESFEVSEKEIVEAAYEVELESPFDKRPELNPFNHRPAAGASASVSKTSIDVVMERHKQHTDDSFQSEDDESRRNRREGDSEEPEDSRAPSECNLRRSRVCKRFDERLDDNTTQSEEESRRSMLRKKVDDRREVLASMFNHTQEVTLSTENEILDLKRKLAMSQALVQQLEIENRALERKAILDFSEVQMKLLKQRDNREKVLENRIKRLMVERDDAVLECHDLRILIIGSCDACRQRFDYQKQYTMDYSIRNTILSRRNVLKSSAFEWLTAGLAEETESVNSESDKEMTKTRITDSDALSMDTTLPDSHMAQNAPSFQFVPLQWLSAKLTSKAGVLDSRGQVSLDDRPDMITCNCDGQLDHESKSTIKEPTAVGISISLDERKFLTHVPEESRMQNGDSSRLNTDTSKSNVAIEIDREEKSYEDKANETGTITKAASTFFKRTSSINDAAYSLPATVTTPSGIPQRQFFDNLVGEKYTDDFSSTPSTSSSAQKHGDNVSKATDQKKRSFFSSLFGEKVDEAIAFSAIDPSRACIKLTGQDSASPKSRKFGSGLKGERVLDDMEILNSIMLPSSAKEGLPAEKTRHNLTTDRNNKRFALSNEQFNDDDYDRRLLGAVGQSIVAPDVILNNREGKASVLSALRPEQLDDDNRDARILNLLKEDCTKERIPERSPLHARSQQGLRGQSSLSPKSMISSPFGTHESSPRKQVLTNKGRRGASSPGNYLGRLSVNEIKSRDKISQNNALPLPHPLSPSPNFVSVNPNSGSPMVRNGRFASLNHVPIDVELEGERPWRCDSGRKPSKSLILEEHTENQRMSRLSLEDNYETCSLDEKDEDLDQILALLAVEGT